MFKRRSSVGPEEPFEDFTTMITADGRAIPIRITASALHALWGRGVGPQTADGIFWKYRAVFDELVAEKLESGEIRDGLVVISDADLDL